MVHGEALGDVVSGFWTHCRGEISGKESVMSISESKLWCPCRVVLLLKVESCCW